MWPFSTRHSRPGPKTSPNQKPVVKNHLGGAPRKPFPAETLMETMKTAQESLEGISGVDIGLVQDLITETKTFSKQLETLVHTVRQSHGATQSVDIYNGSVEDAYNYLKNTVGQSPDINIRRFVLGRTQQIPAVLVFNDGLADNQMIDQDTIALMQRYEDAESLNMSGSAIHQFVHDSIVAVGHATAENKWSKLLPKMMGGNTLVFIQGAASVLVLDTVKYPARGIERPETERAVKGPQESFNEVVLTQMNLIRRRIKSPKLHFDKLTIGTLTHTMVIIAHIEGLTNPELVMAVKRRLRAAKVDSLQYSNTLGSFLSTHPMSLFPQVRSTERVDIIVRDLLQGKVSILVDNTPFALAVPSTFMDFYQTTDDYTVSFWTASMERLVRLFGLFVGLLLPPLYVAFVSVDPNLLPLKLIMTIAGSREDIPFPPLLEVLIMWVIIEVLREAAIRLPQGMSTTLGTVGAIVVGTAIVNAGIVDNLMIVIITLTALGLFTSPVYEMATPWRILFWVLVFASYIFGLYGIVLILLIIITHLVSLENFGVPYLSPFGPIRSRDLKDTWIKFPPSMLTKRPTYLRTLDLRKWRKHIPHPMKSPQLYSTQQERLDDE
ncbi:MAG: spore germination protein [Sulfobacillus thermosulfidooxidans]|nr:MAG: spore germination protein [Sulfobacillus thermosulfidooxidans]